MSKRGLVDEVTIRALDVASLDMRRKGQRRGRIAGKDGKTLAQIKRSGTALMALLVALLVCSEGRIAGASAVGTVNASARHTSSGRGGVRPLNGTLALGDGSQELLAAESLGHGNAAIVAERLCTLEAVGDCCGAFVFATDASGGDMLGLAQLFAVGALDRRAALLFDLVERTFTMVTGG